jgi:hypothetical protein
MGRWTDRIAWLLGALLVCVGALTGAFGTVAWLSVLCAGSLTRMMIGIFALGVGPVVGGGALLWAGLSVLESHSTRRRVRALSDERFVEAVRGGATPATIALRLGVGDVREVERRLDDLVARDALVLAVSDEGELYYQEPPGPTS